MHKHITFLFIFFNMVMGYGQTKELEQFLKVNNSKYDSLLKQNPAEKYLEPPKPIALDTSKLSKKMAPKDTIFYDANWNTCDKAYALYYRLVYLEGDLYIVNDYYLNGILQMSAKCTSLEPEIKHGIATYYYPNGKRKSKGAYLFDEPTGVWTYYNKFGLSDHIYDYSYVEIATFDSSSWIPQNQSSLFIANINYRFKVNKSPLNSGHGFGIEVGLNLGYFISQKLLLAPFGGLSTRDLLYQTKFNSGYLNDFNSNFNGTDMQGNDSMVVNYMASIINEKGYFHDRTVYYGLMIKLPYKYMPIIKVYKGGSSLAYKTSREPIQPKPYVPSEKRDDNDYFDIYRKMNWGFEVFLYNGRTRVIDYNYQSFPYAKKKNLRWCSNLLAVSMYFEEYDTYHTTFSFSDGYHNIDVPMQSFMNQNFMNRNKKEYNIGIRLSYGVF